MEIRPIDANALKREILNQLNRFDTSENEFNNCYPYWIFSKTLKEAPTLDYEPVRHGEWVEEGNLIWCSRCLNSPLYDYFGKIKLSDSCPYCGAKMRKGEA